MTEKTFTSVAKMIRDITNDDSLIEAVDEALDRQAVLRQLMSLRAARGLSQSDVAKAMGCTQSKVSKIESSGDAEVQFGDLQRYAIAVQGELCAGVRPRDMEPATEVKCLAIAVQKKFKRMADLANQDDKIAEGVTEFFMEALLNFNLIIAQAVKALPKDADGTPRIHINIEMESPGEEEEDEPSERVKGKRSQKKRKAIARSVTKSADSK